MDSDSSSESAQPRQISFYRYLPFERSSYFKQLSLSYCWGFSFLTALLFLVTIFVPYFYDQKNLGQFIAARESNDLVVREYLPYQAMNEHGAAVLPPTNIQGEKYSPLTIPFKALKDKKIISSDYISQMQNAEVLSRVKAHSFGWTVVMGILLMLFNVGMLWVVKNHGWRAPLIAGSFFLFLVLFWLLGDLPHVNKKFHVIMGSIYALILAASDFLFTLDLKLENINKKDNFNGRLSSLQYKHRFYCIAFNTVVIFFVTLLGTFGFKTMDFFYKIFGEGFVIYPLIGLLISMGFATFVVILFIIFPLRRHLADIENAMAILS